MKPLRTKLETLSALALPLGIALVVQGSVPPATAGPAPAAIDRDVSFANQIMPILQENCVSCHGGVDENGEVVVELSLDMTTYEGLMAGSEYGSILEAGNPDESLIVEMVEMGDMPEEGDPLSPEQIELLRTWIAEGARNN